MADPTPARCVVVDREDSPASARFLADLREANTGQAVAEIRPQSGLNTGELANAVLEGIGKDLSLTEGARNETDRWRRAQAWLVASEFNALVISRAHLLHPRQWQ